MNSAGEKKGPASIQKQSKETKDARAEKPHYWGLPRVGGVYGSRGCQPRSLRWVVAVIYMGCRYCVVFYSARLVHVVQDVYWEAWMVKHKGTRRGERREDPRRIIPFGQYQVFKAIIEGRSLESAHRSVKAKRARGSLPKRSPRRLIQPEKWIESQILKAH